MCIYDICIIVSTIGAFINILDKDWTGFCCFLIALIVNGIYLIENRIKELKK